jgi:acetylglutamate kinase
MTSLNSHPQDSVENMLEKARILSEALPYMRKFAGKTFVIKYGGHAMGDPELSAQFARDVVLLKRVGINPIIVHGGGPQIGRMLEQMKIQSSFIDGLRVTDAETVDVVEMVLSGKINKEIVTWLNHAGGRAIGLSGKDGELVKARKLERTFKDPDSNIERLLDLGFVGEPYAVDPLILQQFIDSDIIPVIAPIGLGDNGETFNINADTMAGAIASAVGAARLYMLTDVSGVLDKDGNRLTDLTAHEVHTLIADGTISGGMIPKVETCLKSVENNVNAAVILNGKVPHTILLEIYTQQGAGTLIRAK